MWKEAVDVGKFTVLPRYLLTGGKPRENREDSFRDEF
jgi:hypothetical protein